MTEVYFNPANIFLMRDFYTIATPMHGKILIDIVDSSGWRARKSADYTSLVSGLDVWSMCRWLNDNRAQAERS